VTGRRNPLIAVERGPNRGIAASSLVVGTVSMRNPLRRAERGTLTSITARRRRPRCCGTRSASSRRAAETSS